MPRLVLWVKQLIVVLAVFLIALPQFAFADIVTLKCTRTDDASNTIKVLVDQRQARVKVHLLDWVDILHADDRTLLWNDNDPTGSSTLTYLLNRSSLHLQVTIHFNDLVIVQNRRCVRPL